MIGKCISHYKILEKLGEGGMGVVYKAKDKKLQRTVALKFLPDTYSKDSKERQRLVREAQAAASLSHPNIGSIYELGEDEDQTFIVMEYIEGETLKDLMKREGPLSIERAFEIAIAVAAGLGKADEKGIVHRDIKSENIMISKDGFVKIMDFGLAKFGGRTKLTKRGDTVGTVDYMSPEQVENQNVDHRSDIYSLGVVLYEMLSGNLPFHADYDIGYIYSILNQSPPPLESWKVNVSIEVQTIVDKMLAKDPENRYQNVNEFTEELTQIIAQQYSSKPFMNRLIVAKFTPKQKIMNYIKIWPTKIRFIRAALLNSMKVIQNKLIINDKPRHILGVFISIYIHVLVIGIFLGLSALEKPEILEIRKISFIDLTQEPEAEIIKKQQKPVIKRENIFKRLFSKKSKSKALKDAVEKPPTSNQPIVFNRRLDMKRKQAPISLARNSPVTLAKTNRSDILKISPAKGTQSNKKIRPASSPINLERKNNFQLTETTRRHDFPTGKTPKPQIVLDKKKLSTEPKTSNEQLQLFRRQSPNFRTTPAGLKKSRTIITGQLASRKILHKSIPKFPLWAKKRGVGATISLNFTVMEDGKVKENILVIRTSGSKPWDDAVIQALKEWRFAALSTKGRRQDQTGVITFQFVIDS